MHYQGSAEASRQSSMGFRSRYLPLRLRKRTSLRRTRAFRGR
jgi:hypothetical protein